MWGCSAGMQAEGATRRQGERDRPAPDLRPDDLVSDVDREHSADLLARAFGDGLLSMEQLDRQVGQAHAASTVAELAEATALLPERWLALQRQRVADERRWAARRAARQREVGAYIAVMVLLIGIWVVSALTTGASYPWPIWPALGWGVPLLLNGRRLDARSTRAH
jgi:hypothetical protein